MKNKAMSARLSQEVVDFIGSRRTLQLASLGQDGTPYASYAPFALGDTCFYIIISEIAVHAVNLQANPRASILIIEDESSAEKVFARIRVNYAVRAALLAHGSPEWEEGMSRLTERHGEQPRQLGQLTDFKMFRLEPLHGRYVKGFGRAFDLAGGTLAGEIVTHLREGHRARPPTYAEPIATP